MNIVFFTNTYVPHVGGVARSVESFAQALRGRGHQVLVVAPEFADMPEEEENVIRIPAIQNFNASDFSVALPFPKGITDRLYAYGADILHSHHPFLLGTTAVRLSRALKLPLVFTHHTLYEEYTHYVVPESARIKTFIAEIASGYANLCDQVIAPSQSVKQLILERNVNVPVEVIPTGVDTSLFRPRDAAGFRQQLRIPPGAFVVGHMGRLAPEKNIAFLAESVGRFLKTNDNAVFLVIGEGPSIDEIRTLFNKEGLNGRLFTTGVLSGEALVTGLNAMDLFAFASRSETQGMVITEAMATGLPVVALDASGVGELVEDGWNGRKLGVDSCDDFAAALEWVYRLPAPRRRELEANALACAADYSLGRTTDRLAALYLSVRHENSSTAGVDTPLGLEPLMGRLKTEWEIFKKISHASDEALSGKPRA